MGPGWAKQGVQDKDAICCVPCWKIAPPIGVASSSALFAGDFVFGAFFRFFVSVLFVRRRFSSLPLFGVFVFVRRLLFGALFRHFFVFGAFLFSAIFSVFDPRAKFRPFCSWSQKEKFNFRPPGRIGFQRLFRRFLIGASFRFLFFGAFLFSAFLFGMPAASWRAGGGKKLVKAPGNKLAADSFVERVLFQSAGCERGAGGEEETCKGPLPRPLPPPPPFSA